MKKEKKSQINQIFVYLVSILIIAFVGFLVMKFIGAFSSDTSKRIDYKLYDYVEKDFKSIYSNYGSEKIFTYRISDSVSNVCFFNNNEDCLNSINNNEEIKNQIKIISENGDTIAIFDKKNQIINSKNIGPFTACFCVKPNNNIIKIIMENNKNKVFIKVYE
jgi:hypothetical protein